MRPSATRIPILTATFLALALGWTTQAALADAVELQVSHAGKAIVEGSTVNFGSTPVGEDLSVVLTVTNVGSTPAVLGPYSLNTNIQDPGRFVFGAISVPSPLPPGASGTVELIYQADAAGTVDNRFRIFGCGPPATPQWGFFARATGIEPPAPDLLIRHRDSVLPNGGTFTAGTLKYNQPKTVTFTVVNQGDAPLEIFNVDFTGDRLDLVQAPPAVLPPKGVGHFQLRLKADVAGSHLPLVKVWSNDPDENPYEFFLSWTVEEPVGPVLRVQLGKKLITEGALVDFGTTAVGWPVTRTFTAYNDGDQPLTVAPIGISSHVSDPSNFTVGFNQVVDVPPGGQADFRLDFDAAGAGTVTNGIKLFVGGTPRLEYQVRGTAVAP